MALFEVPLAEIWASRLIKLTSICCILVSHHEREGSSKQMHLEKFSCLTLLHYRTSTRPNPPHGKKGFVRPMLKLLLLTACNVDLLVCVQVIACLNGLALLP